MIAFSRRISGRTSSRIADLLEVGQPAVRRDQRVVRSEQHLVLEQRVRVLHERRREVLRRPARQVDVDRRLVQADRDGFVLPRERRVRHDDRHLRKVHGDVVDRHRVAVLQADAAAAGHAGADAAVPGVEEHRQPAPRRRLRRAGRPCDRSGKNCCSGGCSFRPRTRPADDQAPRLARRRRRRACGSMLANGDRDVGVRRGEVGDHVVRELRPARQPLVHREDHARHAGATGSTRPAPCASRARAAVAEVLRAPRGRRPCRRRAPRGARARRWRSVARLDRRWVCWSRVVVLSMTSMSTGRRPAP